MQRPDNLNNEARRAENALNVQIAEEVQVGSNEVGSRSIIERFHDSAKSSLEDATTHDEKSTIDANAESHTTAQ